jgi:hypothetical protein
MNNIFQFGEDIEQYNFKVINERDARASAGIMFLLGTISLFSFIMTKNLFWANLFTITFIIEFFFRVFINPKYAPYMILGSIIVSNQEPDWVEAKPKKFAWILGVILAVIMSYFILFNIMTPFRLLTCLLCLFLLYMESVFGICLGCIVYKKLNIKLYKCPGDVCEMPKKNKSSKLKIFVLFIFISLFYGTFEILKQYKYHNTTSSLTTQDQIDDMEFDDEEDENNEQKLNQKKQDTKKEVCTPPQWAIDMGHKEMWIKHNCSQ